MNPETLKQIIEAVNSIGGSAKEAFGYYLLAAYGVDFLKFILGWVGGITLLFVMLKMLVQPLLSTDTLDAYFREVRDRYKLGTSGPLVPSEVQDVKARINAALASYTTK